MKQIAQDKWFDFWFKHDDFLAWRFTDLAWMLRHLDLKEGGSILDAGCGASWTPLMLAIQGYDVVATDLHNFDYGFPQYKFIQGDISTVKFDRQFDRIISMGLLMHIGVQQAPYSDFGDFSAVKNLNQYLKDDGYWIVSVNVGKEMVFPENRRIYSQERLNMLFPEIVEQAYWVTDNKLWRKTNREEAESMIHNRSGPLVCTSCFKARKVKY